MKESIRRLYKRVNRFWYQADDLQRIIVICGITVALVLLIGVAYNLAHLNAANNISDSHEKDWDHQISTTSTESDDSQETDKKLYSVTHIVDGDTIDIDYNGETTRIRLIGVDTPETVDSRTTVQCFGQEASDYLKSTLTGKQVSIESDPTQSDRDKYGRLLRYVYLDGKEDVGLSIIANGYGHEYTYNIPYQKQSEYKTAEQSAESNRLGLWSPTTCNGDTTKPATSQTSNPAAASSTNSASKQQSSSKVPSSAKNTTPTCYHEEAGRCWDDIENEAYSAGLYDKQFGYYGASFGYEDDCDAVCRDIIEDAYEEGWYDSY